MKKNTMLNAMDTLIITAIVVQFIIFLLNYETEWLVTLTAVLQFVFLLIYLIYSLRLRAYFETTVNQEDVFFEKQFLQIKNEIKDVSYRVSDYFDRQRDINDIRHPFNHVKVYYQKKIKTEDGNELTLELLLITDKGIYLVNFFEAQFILKGDFQKDLIEIQYSKHNSFQIINPLSPVHPTFQEVKKILGINDNSMIKRLMIIKNECFVLGVNTLDENQEIAKELDIPVKIRKLMNQSKVDFSREIVEKYIELLDEKIIG